jgi:hypothetical protein
MVRLQKIIDNSTIFSLPGFFDFILETKKVYDIEHAYVYVTAAAEAVLDDHEKDKNVILIGSASKNFDFDLIIGFNSDGEAVGKHDHIRDELVEKFLKNENQKELGRIIADHYNENDCESVLFNEEATANFVKDFLDNATTVKA